MGAKGFYISKAVGVVGIVLGVGAIATIIALSVVYSQEKAKNDGPTNGMVTTTLPPVTTPVPTNDGPTNGTVTTPVPSNEPWDKYRLPKSLVPETYTVSLG